MTFISLLIVLALEQWRSISGRAQAVQALGRLAKLVERHFNAGEMQQGIIGWLLVVLPVLVVTGALHAIAVNIHWLAAVGFNVLILYLTLGFRQTSHFFSDIQRALKDGELDRARALLGEWRGRSAVALSREEVVRVSIEQALIGSHRHVFGVMFWYVMLPGPIGAVMYRVCAYLHDEWGRAEVPELARFGIPARRVFEILDWLPARLTATGFAIVGDFEDAVFAWRSQASTWFNTSVGTVMASGAGAMGVRLGNPLRREDGTYEERPELGLGDEPDVPYLDSTVGLIWRALVLWLALIFIVSIVVWLA